jgi:hypothetical protein
LIAASGIPSQSTGAPQRHILIAGTGRAGTSFLVRYLTALGLDTAISRSGNTEWHEDAQAGFETLPIGVPPDRLPYVLKTPWSYEFIEQLLDRDDLAFDAAIIPIRDLMAVASSRVIVELRAMYGNAPVMSEFDRPWDAWGQVPGGLHHSLEPVDQARLLAVGFHRLVHRLVEAGIPIVFLAFPRLVTDADYLFASLRGYLPRGLTAEAAAAAHRAVSDAGSVRTEGEIEAESAGEGQSGEQYPSLEQLSRIALRREMKRLNRVIADYGSNLEGLRQQDQSLRALLAERESALAQAQADHRSTVESLHRQDESIRALLAERESALAHAQKEVEELHKALQAERDDASRLQSELDEARLAMTQILSSRSWRMTAALRTLNAAVHRLRATVLRHGDR